jgi:hypothetical protein
MSVSLAGLIGNIFSVFILLRRAFNSPSSPSIFAYLRYEAMIGVVGNIVATVFGLNACSDILPLTNNYSSQFIQSYLAIPLYNMTYYAKFLIEIAIVVDLISILAPSFGSILNLNKLFKIKRPFFVMMSICIFTVLINYPYIYLMYAPVTITLVNYDYPDYRVIIYFTTLKTAWSAFLNWGMPGYHIMLIIYIFKNVITFVIETFLNVASLVLFKRHLTRKATLVRRNQTDMINIVIAQNNISNIPILSNFIRPQYTPILKQDRYRNGLADGGRNMAYLVLVKSITGFIHNVLLITFTMYYLNYPQPGLTMRVLQFGAYFASTVRHAVNFFQLYLFNRSFRKEVRSLFGNIKAFNNSVRVEIS